MKWKYIVPVLLIALGAQTILVKGSDLSLSLPESSTGTHQAQNNVTLITGSSYSPGSSGATASFAVPMINAATAYNVPPIDPANRTVNTSYLVGATKGALDVNQAGGANYTIPIDVLPGVNGLAPSLSLVYSSNSGPGVAGYGWQISGISVVGRSGQNYYNDGAARGVELDYNDKFTLDGQRLALTSGTYGYDLATYQTEIEQFTRVQSQLASGNGPLKFLSQTKSGLKNLYGVNDDGRQTIVGYSEVLNWYISQTTDLYGNLISYTYLKDNSTVYPSEINYGPNKVSFSYSDRADITASYFKGQKIQQRFLLDKITVSYNSNVAKTYEMKYMQVSDNYYNYSVLNEVIESGVGGGRLNSTAFSYQVPANVAMAQALNNTTHAYVTYQSRICTGDFNGDGKADFLCLPDATKGATWTGMQICYSDVYDTFSSFLAVANTIDLTKLDDIQALDMNGDGKDDILYELVTAGTSTFYYMINNGTSFGSPVTLTTMTNGANTGMNGKSRRKNNKQENDNQLSGVDYDGDGVNDIFLNDPSGNWKIYSLANSSGVLTSAMILKASGTIGTLNDQTLSGDFNSDGKADIWGFDDAGVKIYTFSGSALNSLYTSALTSKNHFFTLGDFNSDGKVDIFIYGQKIGSTEYDWANWQVQLSTGIGFEAMTIPQKKSNLKNDYVRLGDFNGDGCTDVMVTSSNQSWTGSYFYVTKNKGTDFYSHTLAGYPAELNNFYLGDYNGDGRTDFVSTDGASPWWTGYQLYRTTGNTTPLLEKIGDGLNQLTTIAYTKLSQASSLIYQQGSTIPSFPVFNYQGPMAVVNSVSFDNGIGGNNIVGYGYEGAKIHRQGKGLICFTKINVTDITAVLHTTTQSGYDATYFYPQVTSITKTADSQPMIVAGPTEASSADQQSLMADSPTGLSSLASGTTLQTITNTWAQTVLDANNKRIFPYIQSSTQTDSRTGNSITSSISSIDNYGNPTQTVKSYSNGVSETTVTNYTNTVNSTDWKLGRVDNLTVTSAKTGETSVVQTVRYTYSTDGILKPDYIYYYEGTALAYTKNHDYDSKGNLTQVYVNGTSVGASQTNYTYDTNGIRILTATDVLGHVTTNTYDTYGRLYTETDYLTNVNTYGYDALSRQTSVSNTNGSQATTAYVWTGLNKPASGVYGVTQTGNDGSASTAWYDKLQRDVRQVKTGFGGQMILTDKEYNALGETYRVTDPYFDGGGVTSETITYNYGRVTDVTRSSGRNTHFDYSGIRVTETTGGATKWKETDSQGLLTTASDNGGNIVYAYYPDGKVKTITAPGSVVTSMQYADAALNQTQMNDPSAGTINYTYDAFGRVKTQTDARGRLTTTTYLPDGRMDNVVTPEGTTIYTYNTNKQLTGISNSTTGVSRTYGYDTKGRVITVGETIAGSNFSTSFTYDSCGRLSTRTHPSGIVETMGYNSNGYLATISAGGSIKYTITGMNAREQLTAATYGSNLTATFGFDTYGYPSSTAAVGVQDYRYVFNSITGNLTSRQNFLQSKSESFTYVNYDRLFKVTGPQNLTMTYNLNGNIGTKSDIGTYDFVYGTSAKPYQLTSVTSTTGIIPVTDQTATYNSFEKVNTLTEGVYAATFVYNSDNQRAKMDVTQSGANILTRWYAGSSYMKETAAGVTKEYTYLGGDAYSAPVVAVTQSGTTNYFYLLRDYLGNITHQVNTSNTVVAEYSFDAWGRRRNPTDWSYTLTGQPELFADRGFTSHEFLKYFNIYNMNGRLFDPLVGRFLNPDNVIQDPTSTQNYNRYSYCLNNPLKYTDPSGNTAMPLYPEDFIPGATPSNIQDFIRHHGGGSDSERGITYGAPSYNDWARKKNAETTWVQLGFFYHDVNGNPITKDEFSGEFWVYEATFNNYNVNLSGQRGDGWLNTLNTVNTWVSTGAFATGKVLSDTRIGSDIGFRIAYKTIGNATKYIQPVGVGTSIVGAGIGFYKFFGTDNKTWGVYGQLGVSLISSGLTLSGVTAPVGIGIGVIDTFGGFNGFYNYLDNQQQLYNSTGGLLVPVNGIPSYFQLNRK